jgi:hypothetical protein
MIKRIFIGFSLLTQEAIKGKANALFNETLNIFFIEFMILKLKISKTKKHYFIIPNS